MDWLTGEGKEAEVPGDERHDHLAELHRQGPAREGFVSRRRLRAPSGTHLTVLLQTTPPQNGVIREAETFCLMR